MFWKYNLITTSHIETLLDNEDVTLRDLMDQEDVLQECKAQSKKLIDFLVRPESMDEMITLITQEPDEQINEKIRYKYSNISCELLTFDVATINDSLCENEALLDKLYGFLDTDKPLNPLLASFFSKTISNVFSKKTETIFEYLKSKTKFITLLLNHIETSAIMDLLIKLITYSEPIEMRKNVFYWLNEHSIVQRLVDLIDPAFSEECHCNAAQALCDMIKSSREQMSLMQEKAEEDPLLKAVESPELSQSLLSHMFSGEKKESVFVNGISVLLALLEFKKHGPMSSQFLSNQLQSSLQDSVPQMFASFLFRADGPEQMTTLDAERLAQGVNNVLDAVFPQIADFHNLFRSPPSKPPMNLTIGCLDPPLGYTRLKLMRFIVALITTNTHRINCKLSSLQIIHTMMELFFDYPWNNFLHTQVEHAIGRILSNAPTVDNVGSKVHPLLDQLIVSYRITEKIIETFKECEKEESEKKAMDKGYMGHLTKIANHIAHNMENGVNEELIKIKLEEVSPDHLEEWEKFSSNILMEVNKKNTTPLVGGVTLGISGDESVFKDLPFNQDSAFQQAQQISNNHPVVTQFCYSEWYGDNDENSILVQPDRLAQVHYNSDRTRDVFERVCQNRTCSINDDNEDEIWEDGGSFRTRNPFREDTEDNSSDSEEETTIPTSTETAAINNDEVKMEIDNQDGWTSNFESVPMEVVSTSSRNLWDSSLQSNSTSDDLENWADFSTFDSNNDSSGEISSSVVAMETSDAAPLPSAVDEKLGSCSEVGSSSNSAIVSTADVPAPVEDESFGKKASSEESGSKASPPPTPPSPPSAGDSSTPKDESEAKVIALTDKIAQIVESTKECPLLQDAVQNGPI